MGVLRVWQVGRCLQRMMPKVRAVDSIPESCGDFIGLGSMCRAD